MALYPKTHAARRGRTRTRVLMKQSSAAAVCLLLGGCTLGPDFHSPAAQIARQYTLPTHATSTTTSQGNGGAAQHFNPGARIAADWYTLFKSPQLDSLIEEALENNPSLAASQASLRQAAYQLEATTGSSLPNVNAGGSAGRQRSNGAQIGLDNPLFNNVFDLYNAHLSLGYDLDLFGLSARKTEAQAARTAYQRDLLRGTRLALIDNVVATTVHYATLRDSLAATRKMVAVAKDQADLLTKQEQAGAVPYADVLRARAQLADTRTRLPPLEHNLAVTRHALAQLVGADPETFQAPSLSLADLRLPRELPVSLSSQLVRQRPDILAAAQHLHAASAEVGIATAELYPNISLSADFGTAANHPGDILKSASEVWSLGASLAAPLFHGGSLRANVKAAKANWENAYDEYRQTVLAAFTQVADVLDAIGQDAESLRAQTQALKANRASLTLMRKQYQAGATDYLDVLDAEQQYNQALLAQIDAVSRRYIDTASLYHALGGGWWNQPNQHHRKEGMPVARAQP